MDKQTIEEKVIEMTAEQFGVEKDKINRETSFAVDLKADSLDSVELLMDLEDAYENCNIKISDEAAEKIKTVGDAVDYIHNYIKEHGEPKQL